MAKSAVLLGTLWVLWVLWVLLVCVREGEGGAAYPNTWNILYDDQILKFSKDTETLFSIADTGLAGKYFNPPVLNYRSLSLNNNYYWSAADTDDAIDNKDELSITFRLKVWPDNTLGFNWDYPLLVKSGSWEIYIRGYSMLISLIIFLFYQLTCFFFFFCKMISGRLQSQVFD